MKRISRLLKTRLSDPVGVMWIWSLPCSLLLALAWTGLAAHKALLGPDFMNFWMGARLVLEGKVDHLYSIADFRAEVRSVFPSDDWAHVFSYPPNILPLVLPFGLLPFMPALAAWSVAGLASFIAALRANRFATLQPSGLALASLSPACIFSLVCGQNGAFTAALFLSGCYLCETSPIIAGAMFGLLTFKPQLGILIPVALLMRRNWTCIASAAATATLLVLLTLLIWGVAPWQDYAAFIIPFQGSLLDPAVLANPATDTSYARLMPGPYMDFAMVPRLGAFPWVPWLAAAAFAAYASFKAVKKEGFSPRGTAILALATLVISPYSFNYDMVMVMGAIAVWLATLKDIRLSTHLIIGLLWVLPGATFALKQTHTPLSSLVMIAGLICLHLAVQRQKQPSRKR